MVEEARGPHFPNGVPGNRGTGVPILTAIPKNFMTPASNHFPEVVWNQVKALCVNANILNDLDCMSKIACHISHFTGVMGPSYRWSSYSWENSQPYWGSPFSPRDPRIHVKMRTPGPHFRGSQFHMTPASMRTQCMYLKRYVSGS